MARKLNWRAFSIHRNYSVDQASLILGVAKGTIRRWIKTRQLRPLDDSKPTLILGTELIEFGKRRRMSKQSCRLDQCFCMRCQAPKNAALAQAELVETKGVSPMVRMLCETCATLMNKRVSRNDITRLSGLVSLTAPHALKHLIDSAQPCANDHNKKDC